MDLARGRAEIVELASDPVVEPGTDTDDQIGAMHRQVGLHGAVHAEHPEERRVGGR